jgi:hypothetical protein
LLRIAYVLSLVSCFQFVIKKGFAADANTVDYLDGKELVGKVLQLELRSSGYQVPDWIIKVYNHYIYEAKRREFTRDKETAKSKQCESCGDTLYADSLECEDCLRVFRHKKKTCGEFVLCKACSLPKEDNTVEGKNDN